MEQRLIENIPICCRQDNLIVLLEDSFVRQNLVAIDQYDNDGHFVSSATCIDIGKRVFLCTAAHNFKGIPKGGKVSFFRPILSGPILLLTSSHKITVITGTRFATISISRGRAKNSRCGVGGFAPEIFLPVLPTKQGGSEGDHRTLEMVSRNY